MSEPEHERRWKERVEGDRRSGRRLSESLPRYSMRSEQQQQRNTSVPGWRPGEPLAEHPYRPSRASFSVPRRLPPSDPQDEAATTSPSLYTISSGLSALSPSDSRSSHGDSPLLLDGEDKDRHSSRQPRSAFGPRKGHRKEDLIQVTLPWRPPYLQRKVLIAFFSIFAAAIICLETLLDYSSRNAGLLSDPGRNLHYVWALTPTGILVVIALLWSRVDFQAKVAAPWLRLAKGPADADRTVLLDYISLRIPLQDVVRAFRNGDRIVACAALISAALKLAILLSTATISLTDLSNKQETVPITVASRFIDDPSGLADIGPLPLLSMLELERSNMAFPDGTSSMFAFQQFQSDVSSPSTMFQLTVDGFQANLDCEMASMALNGIQAISRGGVRFNTTFSTDSCTVRMPISSRRFSKTADRDEEDETYFFARFGHASCEGAARGSDDAQRIVVFYGVANLPESNTTFNSIPIPGSVVSGSISMSQQLLCRPTYAINQVDVVTNGTKLSSIALSADPQPHILPNVQPWDVGQAVFDSFSFKIPAPLSDRQAPPILSANVNVDAPMFLAFTKLARDISKQKKDDNNTIPATAFLDADTLGNLSNSYFQQHTALLARHALMQPASIRSSCIAFIGGDRLVVSTAAVQSVVILLAAILLLNMVIICLVPSAGFLPRDPNSVIDMVALLSHSHTFLKSLRGTGCVDTDTLRQQIGSTEFYTGVKAYERGSAESGKGTFCVFGSTDSAARKASGKPPQSESEPAVSAPNGWMYSDFVLTLAQRVLAYVVVVGLVAVLEATLHISDANQGFATVIPDSMRIMHFQWKVIPMLVILTVAAFFFSMDSHMRALAPFIQMAKENGAPFSSLRLNLLDRTAPRALYKAVRDRNFAVAGATAAACAAMILPIVTPPLFTAKTIPKMSAVQLFTEDFFSTSLKPPNDPSFCVSCADGVLLASLILDGNMSYPAFTFNNLAFPTLNATPVAGLNATDDFVITTTVPAVRSSMSCRLFSRDEIGTNLTNNFRLGNMFNPLFITLPGEPAQNKNDPQSSTLVVGTARPVAGSNQTDGTVPTSSLRGNVSNAFFGRADYRPLSDVDGSDMTHWVYAWGQLRMANTNATSVMAISAMSCNETMQQVDVRATFGGSRLVLDATHPPVPMEETARLSDVALTTNLNYSNLVSVSTPHRLDAFFGLLVSSQYAIPMSLLGSNSSGSERTTTGGSDQSTKSLSNPVANAIVRQHEIIRAQVVNIWNRRPTESFSPEEGPVTTNGTIVGNATQLFEGQLTSVSAGIRRLLQDAPSTRIIQALLIVMLICSVAGWAALPVPSNLLPRPPTSIASTAALLADGNLIHHFQSDAEWQTVDMLRQGFHDDQDDQLVETRFKLGWSSVTQRRHHWQRQEEPHSVSAEGKDDEKKEEDVFGIGTFRAMNKRVNTAGSMRLPAP